MSEERGLVAMLGAVLVRHHAVPVFSLMCVRPLVARCLLRQEWTATRAAWRRAVVALEPGRDPDALLQQTGLGSIHGRIDVGRDDFLAGFATARRALGLVMAGKAPPAPSPFWLDPYAVVTLGELRARLGDAIAAEIDVPGTPGPCPYDDLAAEWNRAVRGTTLLACRVLNEQRKTRMRRAWTQQLRGSLAVWRLVCQTVAADRWSREHAVAIDHVLWERTLARRIEEAMAPRADALPRSAALAIGQWMAELRWRLTAEVLALEVASTALADPLSMDAQVIRRTNEVLDADRDGKEQTARQVQTLLEAIVRDTGP
jgi:hypothetical protein